MADQATSDASGPPDVPQDSVGSSVSSRYQDEYDELLRYAVVVPKVDFAGLPNVIADPSGSFRFAGCREAAAPAASVEDSGMTDSSDEVAPRRSLLRPRRRLGHTNGETAAGEAVGSTAAVRAAAPAEAGRWVRQRPESPTADDLNITADDSEDAAVGQRPGAGRAAAAATARLQPPAAADCIDDDRDNNYDRRRQQQQAQLPQQGTDRDFRVLQSPMLFSNGAGVDGDLDEDIRTMESKLNLWCRDLKTNIVEEVARMKIKLIEQNRHTTEQMSYEHAKEMQSKQNDLEGMKELLHTYEVSIERKDAVIANLTRSLESQKEKFDVLRNFTEWKLQFYDRKQEGYATRLAKQHCRLTLMRKAWRAWHVIIEEKWRHRVEKACQARAQEVCVTLTNDYEARLASLNEALDGARQEVERLHREREKYEENMKKAFMRGVCALNLEAMNIFHDNPDGKDAVPTARPRSVVGSAIQDENADPLGSSGDRPLVIQQEPVYSCSSSAPCPTDDAPARRVTAAGDQRRAQQQQMPAAAAAGSTRAGTSAGTVADLYRGVRSGPGVGKKSAGSKQFSAKLVSAPSSSESHASNAAGMAAGRAKPEGLTGLGHVVVQCHRDSGGEQQPAPQPHEAATAAAPVLPKHKPVQLPMTRTVKIVK